MSELRGALLPAADGTTVRFERRYGTSPEDLWSAVTEPGRLARWLGPVYGDLREGGRYELRMGEDVAGAAENATGRIRECVPPQRLVIEWEFPGESTTLVEAVIRPDGDGAVLVLEHHRLEESNARSYGAGWHASLGQLADHVSGDPVRAWAELYRVALPLYVTD
ncbi:SRPBCC family protein [Cellulomonas sp. URHD0024]|uniref:SRPBCC family protein n=1 Tax=Cellulomonas sp. URHD0024 TaxID=1302620 RepID=UPI0004888E3F|nr:SRPBCC family protein [Cellulomonas sp. URHD0024]